MKFLGRAKKFLRDLGTEPAAKVQYFNVACASGHRVRGERTEGYQGLRCPACGEGVFVLPRSPLPEPAAPARSANSKAAAMRADRGFVEEGPVELTDPRQAGVELADRGPGRIEAEIIWDDEPAEPAVGRGAAVATPGGPHESGVGAAPEENGRGPVSRGAETPTPSRNRAKSGDQTTGSKPGRVATPATEPAGPGSSGQGATRPRRVPEPAPEILDLRVEPRRRSRHGLILVLVSMVMIAAVGWRYWKQPVKSSP